MTAHADQDEEGGQEHSSIVSVSANCYNHFENQYSGFSDYQELIYLKIQQYNS